MKINLEHLRSWIGRTETSRDQATLAPLRALSATLDRDDPEPCEGDPLPALWHWLYFLPTHRQSEIGTDGHARRGGFLPPVPLARRMWAGSRLEFHADIRAGASMERVSTIEDVRLKEGKSGPLVFVVVRHEISSQGQLAIREWHDIVYREMPQPGQPSPAATAAPPNAAWCREIVPDSVLLFRYSALTFNGHRIHIDRSYATGEEHYPGLIVHGPLIATLLLDLLRRHWPQSRVARFAFKAVQPLFDIAPFKVCGRPDTDQQISLWAENHEGQLAIEASAHLR